VDPRLAAFVPAALRRNAVIGPTWATVTESLPTPLAFFLLIWGSPSGSAGGFGGRRRLLPLPLIREEPAVLLVGIASGWWVAAQHPRRVAMALGGWGLGWVLLVTNPVDADLQ